MKKRKSQEKRSTSAPPVMISPRRHLKWTDRSMVAAIKAVVEGSSSVNKAAKDYRVLRTTLQKGITGRVLHELSLGLSLTWTKQKKMNWLNFLRLQQRSAMVKLENK